MLYVCEICKKPFTSQPEAAAHEEKCARENRTALTIVEDLQNMIATAKAAGLSFGIPDSDKKTGCANVATAEYDHERRAVILTFDI